MTTRGPETAGDPLAALASPDEWEWAAPAVAAAGDRAALPALVAAYELPVERSRLALLRAIEALDGARAARELATSADPAERRLAARLAGLLPSDDLVEALEPLVTDPEPRVAREAGDAMRTQLRTPEWRAAVTRLAASDDPEVAAAAAAWLRE